MTLPLDSARPADSDGYTSGQRDRALVLDFYAKRFAGATVRELVRHPSCTDLTLRAIDVAVGDLRRCGLLAGDGEDETITPAGLAAHSAAQRAIADLDAAIGA